MCTNQLFIELMAVGEVTEFQASGARERRRRGKSKARGVGGVTSAARGPVTGKQLGEMAEAAFVAKVAELGFGIAKPWGDSDPYDFITRSSRGLLRVQVKSAHRLGQDGCYSFRTHGHGQRAYRANQIDVLVAYVVPEKAWYVFPVRVVRRLRSLKLFPSSRKKRSRFEKYREAWGILDGR